MIITSMGNKLVDIAAFLDLTMALDSVDYNILFHRLSSIGLSESYIDWFASYLNNQVKSENVVSEPFNIINGVPQGSSLDST